MKKTACLFTAMIVLVGLLTGCECKHEWDEAECLVPKTCKLCAATEGEALGHTWKEASCTTAKICAVCGETEGEPLGHNWTEATCAASKTCAVCGEAEGEPLDHNWTEATCSAPQTCSACGETQGDSLAHSYETWKAVDAETMSASCTVCGYNGRVPINHEQLVLQELEGHWDFLYYVSGDGMQLSANDFNHGEPVYYLQFSKDHTGVFYMNGHGAMDITWTYHSLQENGSYVLIISGESIGDQVCLMEEGDDGSFFVYIVTESAYFGFYKNVELAEAVMGTWVDSESGEGQMLTLNADRTASGTLFDQQINGTWHLRPTEIYTSNDGEKIHRTELIIRYIAGEKEDYAYALLESNPNDEYEYYLECAPYLGTYFMSDDPNEYACYAKMDQPSIDLLRKAMEQGSQRLIGPWEATSIATIHNSTGEIQERQTGGYSITFAEDGTFTAVLDKERQGTWVFRNAYVYAEKPSYWYDLTFDGIQGTVLGRIGGDGEFYIVQHSYTESTELYFIQMTPESIAERNALRAEHAEMIGGAWFSVCKVGMDSQVDLRGYSITFAEDGTFTAKLDKTYSGTWKFDGKGEYDIFTDYAYILQFDFESAGFVSKAISLMIYSPGYGTPPDGEIGLSYRDQDGHDYTIWFHKFQK